MTFYIIVYFVIAGMLSFMYLSDMWKDELTLEKWIGTTVLFPVLIVKALYLLVKAWWWLVQNLLDCVSLAWKTIW